MKNRFLRNNMYIFKLCNIVFKYKISKINEEMEILVIDFYQV